jgi:hypothetical protein
VWRFKYEKPSQCLPPIPHNSTTECKNNELAEMPDREFGNLMSKNDH